MKCSEHRQGKHPAIRADSPIATLLSAPRGGQPLAAPRGAARNPTWRDMEWRATVHRHVRSRGSVGGTERPGDVCRLNW